MDTLRQFQARFIGHALADGIDTAVLSLPRGNGKSWLAGWLATRVLRPGDELFQAGTESVLGAGSIEQARIVYKFVRDELEPLGALVAQELSAKLGVDMHFDFTSLWGHDLAGRAASFAKMVSAGMDITRAASLSGLLALEPTE